MPVHCQAKPPWALSGSAPPPSLLSPFLLALSRSELGFPQGWGRTELSPERSQEPPRLPRWDLTGVSVPCPPCSRRVHCLSASTGPVFPREPRPPCWRKDARGGPGHTCFLASVLLMTLMTS